MSDLLSNNLLLLNVSEGGDIYTDTRYSDDKISFTSNNGLTPGTWLGIYTTNDSSVLDPSYVPIFDNYNWSKTVGDQELSYYYFEASYSNIYKFFTTNNKYSYAPATLSVNFFKRVGETAEQTKAIIKAEYKYIEDSIIKTGNFVDGKNGYIELNLNDPILSDKNIEVIKFSAFIDGNNVLSQSYTVSYGTTADMAKLSLHAADITASILNTKLVFNSDGLGVHNGGLTVFDNENNKTLYIDETGNLVTKGIVETKLGHIGEWIIDDKGLTANNKQVGLYAGNELYYPNDIDPVRFWAKDDDQFNFAVTQTGKLYANKAEISGKIIAKEGRIENDFLVGTDTSGIIMHGGTEGNDSFISSAQYTSGTAGYGWRLAQDGSAEFSNITARGKISSSVFEHNKISSIGGSLYVAPTIYIDNESSVIEKIATQAANNDINYKVSWLLPYTDLNGVSGRDWNIGDEIKLDGELLEVNSHNLITEKLTLSGVDATVENIEIVQDTYTKITVIFKTNKYQSITESGITEKISGKKFCAGSMLVLYGANNQKHGLYLTASDANSPYLDVYDDDKDTVNAVKPAVRIGNLAGVVDKNFPESILKGYGLYSSNAYLRGQLMLPGAGITNQNEVVYGVGDASSPIRIWAGVNEPDSTIDKANFIVTANGYMYAKQGVFEGTVIAKDSVFSGTIRAAGIVIDPDDNDDSPLPSSDHFFVGYTNNPKSFNDYVLDIGSKGLSIWEGGFRAYSDVASGKNLKNVIDPIYGYSEQNQSPMPYVYLVDNGAVTDAQLNLDARLVTHKLHNLQLRKTDTGYHYDSINLNNGIWFNSGERENLDNIEQIVYSNNHSNGISFNGNTLKINNSNNVEIDTQKTLYINPAASDINNEREESLVVRGQVCVVSDNNNIIALNKQVFREAVIGGKSCGIDIVVKE